MEYITHYPSEAGLNELITAINQRNLVYNYNFLYFSNADHNVSPVEFNTPDGWVYSDEGSSGSINFDGEDVVILTSNDSTSEMQFKQALSEFPRWQQVLCNQVVTASLHINVTGGSEVTASLYDGVNLVSETQTSVNTEDKIFNLQLQVDGNATELTIQLTSKSNAATIKVSKIYANIGTVAVENLPCVVQGVIGRTQQYLVTENAPATELLLCTDAAELPADKSRLNSVINGRFGVGANERSLLPDVRGYFMRAWDNKAAIDPNADGRDALGQGSTNTGDRVGTVQQDIFESHHHQTSFSPDTPAAIGDKPKVIVPVSATTAKDTSDEGGDETRPKNVYQSYTIKWS